MKIICQKCEASYTVDPAKIPPGKKTARCKVCGATMDLLRDREAKKKTVGEKQLPEKKAPEKKQKKKKLPEIVTVICNYCGKNYSIKPEKIPPNRESFLCKSCKHPVSLKKALTPHVPGEEPKPKPITDFKPIPLVTSGAGRKAETTAEENETGEKSQKMKYAALIFLVLLIVYLAYTNLIPLGKKLPLIRGFFPAEPVVVDLSVFTPDFNKLAAVGNGVFGIVEPDKAQLFSEESFTSVMRYSTEQKGDRIFLKSLYIDLEKRREKTLVCKKKPMLDLEKMNESIRNKNTKPVTISMSVTGQKAIIQKSGRGARSMFYPRNTLNEASLFRLVTQFPRTSKSRVQFEYYADLDKIEVYRSDPFQPFAVETVDNVLITLGGEKVTCTVFSFPGKEKEMTFFVDEQSKLRQVVIGEGEAVYVRLNENEAARLLNQLPPG